MCLLEKLGPSSPEVTRAICRVPSTLFFLRLSVYHQSTSVGLRYGLNPYINKDIGNYFLRPYPIQNQSFKVLYQMKICHCFLMLRDGNVNPFSIDYSFRSHLRSRLTLPRFTLDRKPWTYDEDDFHIFLRYSYQHIHFQYLQQTSQFTFNGLWNAPLPYH